MSFLKSNEALWCIQCEEYKLHSVISCEIWWWWRRWSSGFWRHVNISADATFQRHILPPYSGVKVEQYIPSKCIFINKSVRLHNPEVLHYHLHRFKNLKSYNEMSPENMPERVRSLCRVGDSSWGARMEVQIVCLLHEATGFRRLHVCHAARTHQQHYCPRHG